MFGISIIEWVGYMGSALVAISLTMSSIVKLRWFNLAGSIIFAIYGFVIDALPVLGVNGLIILVNIFYLIRMYSQKDYFEILEVKTDSTYLQAFMKFYAKEIEKDYPGFQFEPGSDKLSYLVLRNMAVAGVFLAHRHEVSTLIIDLDFVIPQYGDFKPGKFLLVENQKFFTDKGYDKMCVRIGHKKYQRYFKKMGFTKQDQEGETIYTKKLK